MVEHLSFLNIHVKYFEINEYFLCVAHTQILISTTPNPKYNVCEVNTTQDTYGLGAACKFVERQLQTATCN